MSIRCYIPTTLTALRAGLESVHAVAPDAQGRELGGEELEAREFDALCIAAALAATQAFEASAVSPRAVVAYDAPDSSAGEGLAEGFDVLTLDGVEMTSIASIHLDEAEVWEEAADIAAQRGTEAAEDHLGEADLLWYDVSELPELLRDQD
ncbi:MULTISPECIES: DUF6912 family protein [Brevibacterium]|uniref:Uncharacterized protein n=2 Tax=Brevibacterium TaxID=1696 RepID=A0A1H1LHE3_BRESA|nr:hypothetical protein [Brevibacterium sandarakinum]SDR73827.1 hypothetical protein SAMN04489751_0278 [Brevibacterium sandarakinum]